jgi:MoxR-like ATPase
MDNDLKLIEELQETQKKIYEEMQKVIVGQHSIIEKILIGLFAGAHCLVIGVPGLAKTLMVKTLAEILTLSFKRIQFTPDLMPSDITGTEIIQENGISMERQMKFLPGPIFANLLLADEINRAPPKTQAALLEAMQEYQVTAGGKLHPLSKPFVVLATQNPIELEGTYPLPEAQLDRFMLSIKIDYPSEQDERKIGELTTSRQPEKLNKVLSAEKIVEFQNLIRKIPVSDYVIEYAVRLVRNTRPGCNGEMDFIKDYVSWGAGPRAVQYLILGGKTKAALRGDVNVSVSDIKEIAPDVLRHRIFTNFNADADGIDAETIVQKILKNYASE